MRSMKRLARRGVAAVECAVLAPFLVLIVFATIDVGQFVNFSQNVSNASRVGARKATRPDMLTVSQVDDAVKSYLAALAVPNDAIQVTVADGNGAILSSGNLASIPSGQAVSVRVTAQFAAVRWISVFVPLDGAAASATTLMRRD